MTQAHPRDEFDAVVVPREGRRGAHRARPSAARSLLPPLAVGLVAVAAGAATLTVVAETVLAPDSSAHTATAAAGPVADDAAATAPASAAGSTGSTSAAAATSPASVPAASSAAPSAAPSSAARTTAPATSAAAAAASRSTPVVVLNTTRTSGLAARTATKLTGAGWTVSSTGNASIAVRSTIVEYTDPSLAATAASLARAVGGSPQRVSALSSGRLVVVLGPGATG